MASYYNADDHIRALEEEIKVLDQELAQQPPVPPADLRDSTEFKGVLPRAFTPEDFMRAEEEFLKEAKKGTFAALNVGVGTMDSEDGPKEVLWDQVRREQLRPVDVINRCSEWVAMKQREILEQHGGFLPCWGLDKEFEARCAKSGHDPDVFAQHLEILLKLYFMPEGRPPSQRLVGLKRPEVKALLDEHRKAMENQANRVYEVRRFKGAIALKELYHMIK